MADQETPEETPEETPKETSGEVAERTSEEASGDTPEGSPREVSGENPGEASEEDSTGASEHSPVILPADPPVADSSVADSSPPPSGISDGVAPRLDSQGRAYATGKRKDAIARVWIRPGSGKITVNGKEMKEYFARPVLSMILRHPLALTNRESQYDVTCNVRGGGLSGQAGAVRHGLSKALTHYEPELRGVLKRAGALTRDARVVERKKYGRRKARRSFQFSKR